MAEADKNNEKEKLQTKPKDEMWADHKYYHHNRAMGWLMALVVVVIVVVLGGMVACTAFFRIHRDEPIISSFMGGERMGEHMGYGGMHNWGAAGMIGSNQVAISGVVTAVDGSNFTVAGNGTTNSVTTNKDTTYSGTASKVSVNDSVVVVGTTSNGTFTATRIVINNTSADND